MILSISWRNIWRNATRSFVIITAVALGLAAGIFSLAVMNGLTEQKMRTAIENQTSHIQIHEEGFTANKDVKLFLKNADKIDQELHSDNAVKAFSMRTVSTGMVASSKGSVGLQLNGINPESEKQVTYIWQNMREGDYLSEDSRKPILISSKTAEKLEVKMKSKVVLTLQDVNGEIVGAAFRVAGIFQTTSTAFDKGNAFIKKEDLQKLLQTPNQVHVVAILLNDADEVPNELSQLKTSLGDDYLIQSWKEVLPELSYLSDASMQTNFLFLAVILTALAFGILNTMLMSVFERIKEIGVLMAVGMNKLKVFNMIVIETILLSALGALVGMLIGIIIINWTAQHGINLSMFAEGLASYGVSDTIYPSLSVSFYIMLMIMVFVTALLSSIYPAVKALSLRPAEALQGLNN
ncbi:ABC transporter permease [Chondrinema litorale]|uniref:ABC transporter permease n=1 Tax=Chondrinema litorale TaxID=2994555 RepID=UPI002542CDA4|nr:FtsX-like permease family protein [Chondrinema litorale]UZR93857.1 FtsX-like permease family protein [Chondrinema litorale]